MHPIAATVPKSTLVIKPSSIPMPIHQTHHHPVASGWYGQETTSLCPKRWCPQNGQSCCAMNDPMTCEVLAWCNDVYILSDTHLCIPWICHDLPSWGVPFHVLWRCGHDHLDRRNWGTKKRIKDTYRDVGEWYVNTFNNYKLHSVCNIPWAECNINGLWTRQKGSLGKFFSSYLGIDSWDSHWQMVGCSWVMLHALDGNSCEFISTQMSIPLCI